MENMVGKSPEPEPELPPDMLSSIFALLEVPDLVRAGSVCSSWRSVYTGLRRQLRQHKQRQTPCLLYSLAGENAACLYSLAEKRAYKLTLPDPPIRSRYLIGSSHGWLITSDERSELQIVNPITGEQIVLPSVITLEQVKPVFDDEGAIHKYELWEPRHIPDPQTESYIVVLIHNPEYQISFARAGEGGWTFLPPGWNYQECIYKDGILYAVTRTGSIDAFDLSGPTVTRKTVLGDMKNYICEHIYIVQAPWGDMLQVWREQPTVDGDAEFLGHEPSVYALDELRDYLYLKAYLFPDPQTESYIVVLIHNPEYQISFARAGDCGWTFLPPGWNYQECIYKDGILYAVTRTGSIDAFDLSGPTVTRKTVLGDMKNYICEHIYIVQAPWGDMLQVWREQPTVDGDAGSENIKETSKIFVYKIDMAAKKLVEINGLHGHVLFLGHSQTQCLSVEEYPQLKANCVYFTDDVFATRSAIRSCTNEE
uniref:Uncharacterized protein n=1 Tax=Aegilops tauschii TaxID=37682 RepID=M8B1K5_AEGTA